jgi:hypothetical protein
MNVRQLLAKNESEVSQIPEHLIGVPRFDSYETVSLCVTQGEVLTISVKVECELPVRYQWYFGSLSMAQEEPLAGQTRDVLSFITGLRTPTGHYRCRAFSDRCPQGALSGWFFVQMEQRRMGPQKRFFVQVKRS